MYDTMGMMPTKKEHLFQKTLLSWFAQHKRDLPWRKTHDPYKILVSEIMLQQTQVDRVIPKYLLFLKRFPTLHHLARAKRSSVTKVWSGLGYNNRAVRLHKAAQEIVKKLNETFPEMFHQLIALPGVGPYTANALLAFASNKHVAAVDVNHARVVKRFFYGLESPPLKVLEKRAHFLVPTRKSYQWNHALMDFGALVCKSRPLCDVCPLQKECSAYPAVLQRKKIAKVKQERFTDSDRFFRGRIVEELRNLSQRTSISEKELWRRVNGRFPILANRLSTLVVALVQDGVVHHAKRRVRLA